jgi:DNA-binding transcriptional MerR regulator
MHIADLAARTGVSTRLLRYYEQQALLSPARDERGWRVYAEEDLDRVQEIRTLIAAGLPTSAIGQLLGRLAPDGSAHPTHVDDELLRELIAVRDRIDARVRCLTRNRDALDAWLRAVSNQRMTVRV